MLKKKWATADSVKDSAFLVADVRVSSAFNPVSPPPQQQEGSVPSDLQLHRKRLKQNGDFLVNNHLLFLSQLIDPFDLTSPLDKHADSSTLMGFVQEGATPGLHVCVRSPWR